MAKQVTIRRGLNDLYLPNGHSYDGGQVVTLTTEQFAGVDPSLAGFFFEKVETVADPAPSEGGGAAEPLPTYAYDGNTGSWTVQPGRNPGCAQIMTTFSPSAGSTETAPWSDWLVPNPDVAVLDPNGRVYVTEPGLYLVGLAVSVSPDIGDPGTESYLGISLAGPSGVPAIVLPNINAQFGQYVTGSMPVLLDTVQSEGHGLYCTVGSSDFGWQFEVTMTIVRLD
jgi:hypothetical protein